MGEEDNLTTPSNVFLGFDPGGARDRHFGWSICTGNEIQFEQVCSEVGERADDVLNAVIRAMHSLGLPLSSVQAAGIDAPLLWDSRGRNYREADYVIIGAGGHPFTLGMLPGPVLYQGPILANLLAEKFESVRITEAFPGALRQFLNPLPPQLVQIGGETQHEVDARAAAYAAWHMCTHRDAAGWQDLFENVQHPFPLLDLPVSYWMPIP